MKVWLISYKRGVFLSSTFMQMKLYQCFNLGIRETDWFVCLCGDCKNQPCISGSHWRQPATEILLFQLHSAANVLQFGKKPEQTVVQLAKWSEKRSIWGDDFPPMLPTWWKLQKYSTFFSIVLWYHVMILFLDPDPVMISFL